MDFDIKTLGVMMDVNMKTLGVVMEFEDNRKCWLFQSQMVKKEER